ncbi:tropomodulin-like isoform X2 [Amphibalanus amphitrite]|uniref:tropomodulin-like isoform X2 n=2 Tax=Amphibalanus amphitrite TaxID=1232801 RepID=UPI001C8FC331|nr:tropomodulin-like isoform X2 [Amphibalanus amphitrite]XP_043243881.1 tropomodulin-like isoform X2 [Amphibalanus amphitrite]
MEAATEERLSADPEPEPEPRLVTEHPDNPEDYDASVEQKVETREEHGTETDSEGDEYETLTTITRTLRKTTYRPKHSDAVWTEDMNANKKLYGKDLSEYENMDLDELLDQLTPEEVDILTRDVDPDDDLMPPSQRTSYRCEKDPTGPLNRKRLIEHIQQQALNEPDRPEMVPYQQGVVRGKKWIPPPPPLAEQRLEEEIALDLGDEYESALGEANENELVDLAAILGFHSMMNQDQYHASLLGKRIESDVGWAGITRATRPKPMAPEPPNMTDPEQSIERLRQDDPDLQMLNLNNIKNMSDEQIERLCDAAASNTRLENLYMSNTGLSDRHGEHLVALIEKNNTIKEISIESNFISPAMIARLVKALLKNKTVEAFRAANQRSQVLGNKIEMEITKYVEDNPTILQMGLHFEFNDARARVSAQLQKNRDRFRKARREAASKSK